MAEAILNKLAELTHSEIFSWLSRSAWVKVARKVASDSKQIVMTSDRAKNQLDSSKRTTYPIVKKN